MRKTRRARPTRRVASAALLLAIAVVSCSRAGRTTTAPDTTTSDTLAVITADYDRESAPFFPFLAGEVGVRGYGRVLANDIGEDYRRGLNDLCARYRERLRQLDPAPLTDQQRLTYDIFADRMDACRDRLRFPWHLLPVDQVGNSWPSRFPVLGAGKGSHRFDTAQGYEDFLGRIDGFVVWIDTAIANMRTGIARGITQPHAAMLKVVPQLDEQIVDDPRRSAFYEPIRNFPETVDPARRVALEAKYVEAIAEKIVPAYRRLRIFMQEEYLPQCRKTVGLRDIPGGAEMYRHAVRRATTTDLTPDAIYTLGRQEVTRLDGEIDRLRKEIDAAREPAPVRYRTIDELLAGYGSVQSAVDAALPTLFGRLPKARFEIRRVEAFRERTMPSSYEAASYDGKRPAVFYLNAFELETRGAPVSPSLFLHEAVPGHHLQIALQRENRELPFFRRAGSYVAFVEGWALYGESLGVDLGVYRTRHHRLEMLFGDLFRAKRLVVDVGLHAKGWTRAQAIEYLGGRRTNAEREAERYMVWPGQALGYKIGQLKILEIRKKAEAALGAGFDVRAFHHELLRDGAMPLSILEAKMDRWIGTFRR